MSAKGTEHANELAAGYTSTVRMVEVGSVWFFFLLNGLLLYRLWGTIEHGFWGWAGVVVGSYLLADFISGLFHWAADTWGSVDMPLIGKLFVRPFREHHVDQLAITRHDFFEVTGGNCAIALPWFLVHLFDLEGGTNALRTGAAFLGLFLFFIFLTNLSHRWAHAASPPTLAKLGHKVGLLLTPEHHAKHHQAPHLVAYCITSGIVDRVLDPIRFFRGLEVVVSKVTGLVPREEDLKILVATGAVEAKPERAINE